MISTASKNYFCGRVAGRTLNLMTPETQRNVHKILRGQKRIITLDQGLDAGLTRSFIKNRLRSGKWVRRHRGVYVTVTGGVEREAELWAALKRAGEGAGQWLRPRPLGSR